MLVAQVGGHPFEGDHLVPSNGFNPWTDPSGKKDLEHVKPMYTIICVTEKKKEYGAWHETENIHE